MVAMTARASSLDRFPLTVASVAINTNDTVYERD